MSGLMVRKRAATVRSVDQLRRFDFTLMYLAVFAVGMLVAAVMWKRSFQAYIGFSTAVLFLTWLAWIVWPRIGLKLTLFLALLGDTVTVSWFPFNKNLSSEESIFWVSDGVSISPLELTLVVALLAVPYKRWSQNRRPFAHSELVVPLAVIFVAIAFGFANGMQKGGDLRAAIFEVRPLLYFPIIYLVTISVCENVRHYRQLLYTALAAVMVQSMLSMNFALGLTERYRNSLESLTEHGSSISMNLLFVALLASLAIKGCSWVLRISLFVASLPAIWIYLLSQRRVAFVALAVAIVLFAFILFWRQRRTFWLVVPIISLIGLGYVGAFWNATGPAAFPAQAIKTVIAPSELSAADQSSDVYRMIENFNLQATIRTAPLRGTGFGLPFLRPIPLDDISVFEFNEYIPHNSLLWLWIKMGIVGMVAYLYLFARAIVAGVDRVRSKLLTGPDLLVATSGLLFVVMFAIYVFVDIAWEARNSVLLGVCLAMCASPGMGLLSNGEAETDDGLDPNVDATDDAAASTTDAVVSLTEDPLPGLQDRDEVNISRI